MKDDERIAPQLLLLRPNFDFVAQLIGAKSLDELLFIKPIIQSLCKFCVDFLNSTDFITQMSNIQRKHAFELVAAIVAALSLKKIEAFQLADIIFGIKDLDPYLKVVDQKWKLIYLVEIYHCNP